LNGDSGAKSLINEHASEMELVSFPGGSIDIDTEEDYQNLSKEKRDS
jgi:CTP:molybdopterin cytidylyltransferase MocA